MTNWTKDWPAIRLNKIKYEWVFDGGGYVFVTSPTSRLYIPAPT